MRWRDSWSTKQLWKEFPQTFYSQHQVQITRIYNQSLTIKKLFSTLPSFSLSLIYLFLYFLWYFNFLFCNPQFYFLSFYFFLSCVLPLGTTFLILSFFLPELLSFMANFLPPYISSSLRASSPASFLFCITFSPNTLCLDKELIWLIAVKSSW